MFNHLATLKHVMQEKVSVLERNLRKMNYSTRPEKGIIVHDNPECIPYPDLYILLSHMRLRRLPELKVLPFKMVHEVLNALSQEWIDTLKNTFFDPSYHWTMHDINNSTARIFFLNLGNTPYMNAIAVKDMTRPQYRTDWVQTLGFHNGFIPHQLTESIQHLFLQGDQSISWSEHIKMEKDARLQQLIKNIHTVTLLNGYGIPTQLSPKRLHFAGANSLKNVHSPLERVEELAFIGTGVNTETLAHILDRAPNLNRLIVANEPHVAKLPESLMEHKVSIAAIFSPIATIDTQHSQKIEKLCRSGCEELINSGLELMIALKDTSSTVRVGNRMVSAEPLANAFRYIQMTDNLSSIMPIGYNRESFMPKFSGAHYIDYAKVGALLRRRTL